MPDRLTTRAAAERLGISRRQVNNLIRAGILRAERFGVAWQIDPATVEAARGVPRKPGPKKGA